MVVVLIWGGLLYLLFNGPLSAALGTNKLFGSVLSSVGKNLGEQTESIGVLDYAGKDAFRKATVHFDEKINIFDMGVSSAKPGLLFAGSDKGLFASRDNGLNWYAFSDLEHVIDSDSTVYKMILGKTQSFISVFRNGKGTVYESGDDFSTVRKIFETGGEAIYDFDSSGGDLYLGLSNGRLLVYSPKKDESRVVKDFNSPISRLEVSQNGALVYLVLKSGGFLKSEDGGLSFNRMGYLDNFRGADKIGDFSVSSGNNRLIYAATAYGLVRSSDAGSSWKVFKSLPAEEKSVSTVAYLDNPGEIFAASGGKIYGSRDSGLNWKTIETGIGRRDVSAMVPAGGKIIVGTKARPLINLNFSL